METLISCLFMTGPAQAGPIYSLVFDQSNYAVAPGASVTVQVLLREDDTTGGSAFLQNVGLIGAGVLVSFNDPAVAVRNITDIHPNTAAFSDPTALFSTTLIPNVSAGLTENNGLGAAVIAPGSGPIYDIPIGTFTFTASNLQGHSTTIIASRTGPGSQDDVGADFPPTVLDDLVNPGSATITIQATVAPEPGTFGLMIGALFMLLGRFVLLRG
jgi:hypothetical protein